MFTENGVVWDGEEAYEILRKERVTSETWKKNAEYRIILRMGNTVYHIWNTEI